MAEPRHSREPLGWIAHGLLGASAPRVEVPLFLVAVSTGHQDRRIFRCVDYATAWDRQRGGPYEGAMLDNLWDPGLATTVLVAAVI
jgi:hypothetical protein